MSHSGPMYEDQEVSGWTAGQLAEWVAANPGWEQATLVSHECEICGSVVELERLKA